MGEVSRAATEPTVVADGEVDEELHDWLLQRLAGYLEVPVQEVPQDAVFTEVGLPSLKAVELVTDIEERYDLELSPVLLYDYPSVMELARMVTAEVRGRTSGTVAD